MVMPKKSDPQIASAVGERAFRNLLPPQWSVTEPRDDFGEDFVVELFEGHRNDKFRASSALATGQQFGVQLKTIARVGHGTASSFPVDLKRSTISYMATKKYPTFLIVCLRDVWWDQKRHWLIAPWQPLEQRDFGNFYFVRLGVFHEIMERFPRGENAEQIRIHIPYANHLNTCLARPTLGTFWPLLDNDKQALDIERARLLARYKGKGVEDYLISLCDPSSEALLAESLFSLARTRSKKCLRIAMDCLHEDRVLSVAAALQCLANFKQPEVADFLIKFYQKRYELLEAVFVKGREIPSTSPYCSWNSFYLYGVSLLFAAREHAKRGDIRFIDLLSAAWRQEDGAKVWAAAGQFMLDVCKESSGPVKLGAEQRVFDMYKTYWKPPAPNSKRLGAVSDNVEAMVEALDQQFEKEDG